MGGRPWNTRLPLAGDVTWMRGGVVSPAVCRRTDRVAGVLLPARSRASKLIVLSPSTTGTLQLKSKPDTVAGTPLHRTEFRPESASDAVPDAATGELLTVVPSAGAVIWRAGADLS